METLQVFTGQCIVGRMAFLVNHQFVAQHVTDESQTVLGVVVIDIAINFVLVNVLG